MILHIAHEVNNVKYCHTKNCTMYFRAVRLTVAQQTNLIYGFKLTQTLGGPA